MANVSDDFQPLHREARQERPGTYHSVVVVSPLCGRVGGCLCNLRKGLQGTAYHLRTLPPQQKRQCVHLSQAVLALPPLHVYVLVELCVP
jgi:hypothetical protein